MAVDKDLTSERSDAVHRSPDLDAVLARLSFDPGDPASIEAAIAEMDAAIEAKVAPYALNPDVQKMANAKKEAYRRAIRERGRTAAT